MYIYIYAWQISMINWYIQIEPTCCKQDEKAATTWTLVMHPKDLHFYLTPHGWDWTQQPAVQSTRLTKLKNSRSMWNGAQQIANTKTKTIEKWGWRESREAVRARRGIQLLEFLGFLLAFTSSLLSYTS